MEWTLNWYICCFTCFWIGGFKGKTSVFCVWRILVLSSWTGWTVVVIKLAVFFLSKSYILCEGEIWVSYDFILSSFSRSLFCTRIFWLWNFFLVISASRCRLVKLSHINLSVLWDWLILFNSFYFYMILIITLSQQWYFKSCCLFMLLSLLCLLAHKVTAKWHILQNVNMNYYF